MFVTIKPQHLSSVASDANGEFTAQIEKRERGPFKGTLPPKIRSHLLISLFFKKCVLSPQISHEFVVAPKRLDFVSLSTGRFFFFNQSGSERAVSVQHALSLPSPCVTLGKNKTKTKVCRVGGTPAHRCVVD